MDLEVYAVPNWKFFLVLTLVVLALSVLVHCWGALVLRRHRKVDPDSSPTSVPSKFWFTYTFFECVLLLVAFFFAGQLYFETPSISAEVSPTTHVLATDRVNLSAWSQAHYSGNLEFNEFRGSTSLVKNDGTVVEGCSVVYSGEAHQLDNGAITIPAYLWCDGEELPRDTNPDALRYLEEVRGFNS